MYFRYNMIIINIVRNNELVSLLVLRFDGLFMILMVI